ncbi:MAG: rhomboid family intramembrane serine protease [Proteobacteria bacterium]|nr:rhomboid family intramembrane serine protease [Pseudomonadota bacterium]
MVHFQETRQPFFRVPGAVLVLIGVIVAAHLLRVFVFPEYSDKLFVEYGFIPARYSAAYLAAHHYNPGTWFERVVPFVSHLFLHGNWTHLAINMIWLLPFGAVVARRFGPWLFFLFFLVCGVAGAVTHMALNWGSDIPTIGASGAISGLMAAGFRMMSYPPGAPEREELLPLLSRPILGISAVWIALNAVLGMTGFGAGPDVVTNIAWQAHLGGFVAGLLLSGLFDRFRPRVPTVSA